MNDFLVSFSKLGPLFVNFILSLLVAACVALGLISFMYFKDTKKIKTKVCAVCLLSSSIFFIAMIFWAFILILTLKGV